MKKKGKKNGVSFWVAVTLECIASAALGVQASNKLLSKTQAKPNLETRPVVVSYEPNVSEPNEPNQPRLVVSNPNYIESNELNNSKPIKPNIQAAEQVYSHDELKTEIKDGKLLYAIQKGDVFEKIEVKRNLVRGLLQKLNPGVYPRKLKVGQKIIVGYEGKPEFGRKRNLFPEDSNYVILARMLFGEARGCSEFEKAQIGYSAINKINDKIDWNGRTLREVLSCERMYDCFDINDTNWPLVNAPEEHNKKAWEECLKVARGVLEGNYEDKTQGATHYYNSDTSNPYWANSKEFINIGRIFETENKRTKHTFCIKN